MKIESLPELQNLAERSIRSLLANAHAATVVSLSGELGAGKTTFIQAAAKSLGVEEMVTSPTFVIEKIYQLRGQKWERLIHIDAYRLKNTHELEVLGWYELLADPANLIFLEWPERVEEILPKEAICIRFDIDGDRRIITVDGEENFKEN